MPISASRQQEFRTEYALPTAPPRRKVVAVHLPGPDHQPRPCVTIVGHEVDHVPAVACIDDDHRHEIQTVRGAQLAAVGAAQQLVCRHHLEIETIAARRRVWHLRKCHRVGYLATHPQLCPKRIISVPLSTSKLRPFVSTIGLRALRRSPMAPQRREVCNVDKDTTA